jgi:DNA-binding HxlR family transcriptional regulator
MVKRRSLSEAECPVARSLDVMGDWWSLLIVRAAFDGVRRFGEFQRSLGIAKGMLTQRLQSLTKCGVLKREPAADGTAYQEYALTEKGRGLFPVVVALRQWGEQHLYPDGEHHSELVEMESGNPVGRLQLRSSSGRRILDWDATVVRKAAGRY